MKKPETFPSKVSLLRRRLIQTTGFGLLSASALPGLINTALGQNANIQTQRLSASLTLFTGSGCNVLAKQSNGEILLVDGGLENNSASLLQAINAATQGQITRLLNTHWHEQQTGLNRGLGAQGVAIFAHENTRQWLSTEITRPWEDRTFQALPESARPADTFFHYGDLVHGGSTVQYGYLRQAHTDGDMYVYFPEDNVLHGGGVISNDAWPLMDWWTGGWIGGLVDGLEVLLQLVNDDTVIVPANGPVMNKAELQAMRDMYDTIFQRISGGFRAANSVEDTLNDIPTAGFNNNYGDPELFVRRSHESLIPHYTPDA